MWHPVAENCSRRPTFMQVLVPGIHLNATSPFPADYFDASPGAGEALKRSQPRQIVRRGLLPLEHAGGTALVRAAHPAGGSRLRRLPCSPAARLLFSSLRCSPRYFSTRRHPLVREPPLGGCKKRRGWFRAEQGGVGAVQGGGNGRKRGGTAVNATETGRRGLGTVPSGDGHCLARA